MGVGIGLYMYDVIVHVCYLIVLVNKKASMS